MPWRGKDLERGQFLARTRLSAFGQLIIAMLAVLGIVLTLFTAGAFRQQKSDEASVRARILASTVSAALSFDDQQAAQEYVNALQADPEIRVAAIYDAKGRIFASFAHKAEVPPDPPATGSRRESITMFVSVPVRDANGEVIGTVFTRTQIESMTRWIVRFMIIFLLGGMAFAIVIVLVTTQGALRRNNALLGDRAAELAQANALLQAQILEREKVEDALRQAQKMEAVGQLSGGIAHDFNNLLTIVIGNLQLLQRRLAEGRRDVDQYIGSAMEGLTRASNLTQRILAFSRRQPLSPKPVNLSRLAGGMRDLLVHSVGERIQLDTRLAADWWTLCDENQMENVLLNLAINARDAMPNGGVLRVETANIEIKPDEPVGELRPGDYVRLAVADSGTGMTEEVRRRALDPFFTTKPVGQGTGLGLSMIFGYVQQSRGHLIIDSMVGRGTTVSIFMPAYKGPVDGGAPEPVSTMEAAPAVTAAPTVLVVEDEDLVRDLVVETLREEGFTVIERIEGHAAMALLTSDAPVDLLISDVRLPGPSGFQLAEAGKARRPNMKIVLMTGFTQEPIPEHLAEVGVTMLYKPFKLHDMVAAAKRALG